MLKATMTQKERIAKMVDMEKVIKGLEIQLEDLQKYADSDEMLTLTQEQAKEIVALLKEQEAKTVESIQIDRSDKWGADLTGYCPSCKRPLKGDDWGRNDIMNIFSESGKCNYCELGYELVIGKPDEPNNDNYGIAMLNPNYLLAYGYAVHGNGSNSVSVMINYCPMCGKKLKGD